MTKQITQLVLKDLNVYRNKILGFALLGIGVVLSIIYMPDSENIAGSLVMRFSLFISVAGTLPFIDELKGQTTLLSASLPVTRRAIVTSKYLVSSTISICNLLVCTITYFAISGALSYNMPLSITIKTLLIVILFMLFHLAFFYFSFFRFNIIITYIVYAFSQFLPVYLLITIWRTKDSFQPTFENQDTSVFMIAGGVTVALLAISFFVSISNFRQKDI